MTWICLSCMLWVGLATLAGMLYTPVPSLILRLRACGGGSVGGEGGGPLCLWWTEGQTYLSRPSGLVLPHQQGPWPGPTGQYIPLCPHPAHCSHPQLSPEAVSRRKPSGSFISFRSLFCLHSHPHIGVKILYPGTCSAQKFEERAVVGAWRTGDIDLEN